VALYRGNPAPKRKETAERRLFPCVLGLNG